MNRFIIAGLAFVSLVVVLLLFLAPKAPTPAHTSISKFDLLHATDVMSIAITGVEQQNNDMIKDKLNDVVRVAEEMGLASDDLDYLASDQALNYLRFHAKRRLFDEAVVNSYRNLTSISPHKARYPEAKDRFAKADEIIAQRNRLFSELVATLKSEGMDQQQAEQGAKALWLERFAQADLGQLLE
ncbi:hypothetical protein DRW07_06865 [Alteromonas sediminis]|uniref:Uncharacterized protein n=1 Tax=Alteromonas sediminis TaxID=2259342 RepID=A0A3N5Y8A8_9ALTE|nr:hypothetical protein [Alteromonas sediminis]RPJ67249.1 hypothetical protein DRW07_06865 [Alteromonas sediminis]